MYIIKTLSINHVEYFYNGNYTLYIEMVKHYA